jgi:hypothetical protein
MVLLRKFFTTGTVLGLARMSGWNHSGFFTGEMNFFLMEASARAVVSPQRFSRRNMLHCLGSAVAAHRLAVAMEHERTYMLARMSGKKNCTATILRQPFQANADIMNLDFKVFDSERLITEVEKRPALYSKATPEYSDKNCREKLLVEICEAVVPNWSRLDKNQEWQQVKSVKNHFCVHCNLFVQTVEYSFIIFL